MADQKPQNEEALKQNHTDLPPEDDDWLPPPIDQEYDPELENLQPQISWFRPILMLAVMAFALYLPTHFVEEMDYFLGEETPVDLGDVTDLLAEGKKGVTEIPHNKLVKISGLPSRMSISCQSRPPSRFFKLVGAQIYVELPLPPDQTLIACETEASAKRPEIEEITYYEGIGRAVSFDKANQRYGGLKRFYERTYGELFCSELTEAKREERLNLLRQVIRENTKASTGQYPTDAALEELVAQETICHDAVLIQTDTTPKSYWMYPVIMVVLGLIVLWNLVALVLWVRRFLRFTRDERG